MKKIITYTYIGIFLLLIFIITNNYFLYFLQREKIKKNQIPLQIESIPNSLLSKEIRDLKRIKIILIYSEFDCDECIISYLKALKETTFDLKYRAIQVIGLGEVNLAKFVQYAKIYKLNFAFSKINTEAIDETIPGIELPAIILIDGNDKIINCWRADPIQLPIIILKIKKYINSKG